MIYKKQSNPQLNNQDISSPIVEKLTDIVYERFSIMDDKQELHSSANNRNNTEMRTQLEIRLTEIKGSLLEEVNKTQGIHSKSLSDIQSTVQTQLTEAIKNINDVNTKNFDSLSKTNHDKLTQIEGEVKRKLDENFQQNLKSFESVTKNLTQMQETAGRMIDSSKDTTQTIDKFNNIFQRTSSKSFGQFGEQYLETLLEDTIPKLWTKQVKIPGSTEIIDFLIQFGDIKIGIDAKSPFTKYQDYLAAEGDDKKTMLNEFLKSVIFMGQDISQKYGKTGHLDYLLMYVPSDNIYMEITNSEKTVTALQKLHVTPISPTTIFPALSTIKTYQYRLNVNENAEMIIKGLRQVEKNVVSFREEFRKLGEKIDQAKQNYEKADKNLATVQSAVYKLKTDDLELDSSELEPALPIL